MKAFIPTLLFCLMMTQLYAQCEDYAALRALYLSTNGDNWSNNTGWLTETEFMANAIIPVDTDISTWYGVITDSDGCVAELRLSANQLSGSIPAELEHLTNLTALWLHENNLSGSIPSELGNLSELKHLNLSYNQLSGCYDANLLDLCDRLTYPLLGKNAVISDSNDFDAAWDDFCSMQSGICYDEDLVFPGDFDNNNAANGKDLLYWGVAYSYTGHTRQGATVSWTPQYCLDWDISVDDVNSKHQDANGDSVVNMLDLEVLETNYDSIYEAPPFEYEPSDAMFVIEALEIDTMVIPYQIRFDLGIVSDVPVSAHGISTTIDLDAINYDNIQIDTTGSSLHPDAYIYKDNNGTIDVALTRTDKRNNQTIDGPVVSFIVMVSDIQSIVMVSDIQSLIVANNGYMMSSTGELSSVHGSELYGDIDALVSLGVNDAYCDDKGAAKVYMADGTNLSCVWSNGETTTSIEGLDIGSYYVRVNDGIKTTTIPFDIDWAPAPFDINIGGDCVYFDFEQPLEEEVGVSLDGGYSYEPIMGDVDCFPIDDTNEIFIKSISDNCPTHVPVDFSESPFSADLINSHGEVPILEYELKQYGNVYINLYNIHGQQLQTLYEGISSVGIYQIDVDKRNMPHGIYFIRINYQSGNGNHTHTKTLKILI